MGQKQSGPDKSSEKHDGQSVAELTGVRDQRPSNRLEEEQAPSYVAPYSTQAADQQEWNELAGVRDQRPSSGLEEEQAPSYVAQYSTQAADQQGWNDCGVAVWPSDPRTQDNASPPNSFVYESARPGNKLKNVILFGETGVGKSSVINLIAGAQVASTSANLEGCTLEATEYSFTLPGELSLRIYDTVGLNEPEMGVNTFFGAIEKAHKLVSSLHDAGGIDLLLFCIRGNRITSTMQRNYRLFFEFLCEKKVPLAFVITQLEHEDVMEDWWQRNEKTLEQYGMQSVAHACITAAPARVTALVTRRAESLSALQKMLQDYLSSPNAPYVKDVPSWFASMVSFLTKGLPAFFRRKVMLKKLKDGCELPEDAARQLADMLVRGG
jgi:hypothetical protein